MSTHLRSLQAAAWISPLDRHFAEGMGRIGGEARPEVLLAAALTSRQIGAGHVCLDLAGVAGDFEAAGVRLDLALPPHEEWLEMLRHSPIVSEMTGESAVARQPAPLILDSAGRLYLHRYWRLQENLANNLRSRAADRLDSVDASLLRAGLDRYFGVIDPAPRGRGVDDEGTDRGSLSQAAREPDRQRIAAALSVLQRLSVISGGPGTGKTSTVARILALIIEQSLETGGAAPTLTLVAPTGKAAAALADSIRRVALQLDCDARIREAIPAEAATIHRSLGLGSARSSTPRHHAGNPLATDLLLVDEASMVDLVLMNRLVEAVPARARLILLGDEHQLASVEAGAILGDICNSGVSPSYSRDFAGQLAEVTGEAVDREEKAAVRGPMIRDCIARLTRSHRYAEGSGIAALSKAIRMGDAERALEVLESEDFPDVSRGELGQVGSLSGQLRKEIVSGYRNLFSESDPLRLLESLSSFRLLTTHHRGPGGVEELNRLTQSLLHAEALVLRKTPGSPGCPIMITRNDYEIGLFNGDVGILADSAGEGMRAFFENGEGGYRSISPNRLPAHLPAFAMTIHKSQGSEFDRVNVVLPDVGSAILSRELLYTAVTRARAGVRVYGARETIELAIRHRIDRSSGLSELLWRERNGQGREPR